jgi:hypothetical protein
VSPRRIDQHGLKLCGVRGTGDTAHDTAEHGETGDQFEHPPLEDVDYSPTETRACDQAEHEADEHRERDRYELTEVVDPLGKQCHIGPSSATIPLSAFVKSSTVKYTGTTISSPPIKVVFRNSTSAFTIVPSGGGTSRAPVYDFMWSGFVTDDAEQPPLAKQLEPAIEVGLERL